MTTSTLDLDHLTLDHGSHGSRTSGVCLMEAVAWYAGEDHSDMPACVSPVLRSYGIRLNDRLPTERRQELKQFIPALIGTAGDGLDSQRSALARRTLMTEWLPQWLRLAQLDDLARQAEAGADLPGRELNDALYAIRDLTWKARQAARDELRAKVEAELRKRWADSPHAAADADAAAVAAAAADAVADADAAAVAAAAAVAVAVAVAVAAADAAADADAAAAAAAAADAPFEKYSDGYWQVRDAVYTAMRKHYEASPALDAVRALRDTQLDQAIDLYRQMIEVGRAA
jgi:hypothetical protein